MLRRVIPIVIILACAPSASGALYEFTLEGTLIRADYPNTNLGDPLVFKYVVDDSFDANPNPNGGVYAARDARVWLPLGQFASTHGGSNPLTVNVNPTVEGIGYGDDVRGPGGVWFSTGLSILFPPGTLGSDKLPLTLPLHLSPDARLELAPGIEPRIIAQITSYSSVAVPEPAMGAMFFGAIALTRERRTRHTAPSCTQAKRY